VIRIGVEDAGNGVPEDERDIIFDRFSRGSEGGNRSNDTGVGLGLALVDEHIRLHGGRVWVEDRPDGEHGARFVIELPLVDPPAHDEFVEEEA
jgi:signal transduction histidine kinase